MGNGVTSKPADIFRVPLVDMLGIYLRRKRFCHCIPTSWLHQCGSNPEAGPNRTEALVLAPAANCLPKRKNICRQRKRFCDPDARTRRPLCPHWLASRTKTLLARRDRLRCHRWKSGCQCFPDLRRLMRKKW